jgi:two-component system, OmpR family, sensor kinase
MMMTMAMTMTTSPTAMTEGGTRTGLGLRRRIVGGYVALMTIATLASVALTYWVTLARVDARVEDQLTQEAQEIRRLAGGNDPETGEAFGTDVRRVFQVFLERNIPTQNETMVTFVDGEPFLRSRRPAPYRVDLDRNLAARWSRLSSPERGDADTPEGPFRYLAVPLTTRGEARGVFVVGVFSDLERREARGPTIAAGAVGLFTLIVGSLMAWRLAARVIDPVERVTATAQAITETDLARRIDVEGEDEIARLARTFNDMLDRIESAFQTQRQFIDDAGHELRTPITIIRGHLELLGDDPGEREQTLAVVMDELDRMGRMVNDLLILAKADQPDFLQLETVDLAAFTRELRSKARGMADRRWVVEGSGRGVIIADRQRLTQAAMQLAENAIQHTSAGDQIWMGSSLSPEEARIWVKDFGPGIAPDDQERIFRRFRRGSLGPRRSDGAGLGLAIVKAIADAHNGRVEIESSPGAGAMFRIAVPVDQPPRPAEDGAA